MFIAIALTENPTDILTAAVYYLHLEGAPLEH